jgi:CDGSH-type Zn-finger protein
MVTIKVREHGSLLVEGEDVRLIDWNGNEYVVPKKPFSLCRCGHSKEKPFCDSSHKECGIAATQPAPGPRANQVVPPPPTDIPPGS